MSVVGFGSRGEKVFGSFPIDRVARQVERYRGAPGPHGVGIVADERLIVSDDLVAQLLEAPYGLIRNREGAPVAASVPSEELETTRGWMQASGPADKTATWREIAWQEVNFSRKLRKRQPSLLLMSGDNDTRRIERQMFDHVYKGLTDIVTKYVWPVPAFHLVRLLARAGISPNMVTLFGIMLTFLAGYWFWEGKFGPGLLAAWGMTFLDTVDGKLARVTQQSSKLGDVLDHATDIIHPPFWWIAVAIAIDRAPSTDIAEADIWTSLYAILLTYVLGRLVELGFKWRFGINQYIWEPSDGWLRQVIARRNTILLLLSAGFVLGSVATGFVAAAIWSVATIGWQSARLLQAMARSRQGEPIRSWIM